MSSQSSPYDLWNTALVEYFYNHNQYGRPVYLQVDSESLRIVGQKIGIDPDLAEKYFIQALRSYLGAPSINLENIIRSIRYVIDTSPPPFVAFLGLCVLAASKMERDEGKGITAANYYWHLNKLLGINEAAGKPPKFERTPEVWECLNKWLNFRNGGERGIATAQALSSNQRFVTYPQSQCLLRTADRQQLPQFFRWAHLQPEDTPELSWLIKMLKIWTGTSTCTLAQRTCGRIAKGNDEFLWQIASLALVELQAWDGVLPQAAPTGVATKQRTFLQVEFDRHNRRVYWQRYLVKPSLSSDERYISESISVSSNMLQALADDGIVVFGNHPELGRWTQQPRATLGSAIVIFAQDAQATQITHYLNQYTDKQWQSVQWNGVPAGWQCFRQVILKYADPNARWEPFVVPDSVSIKLQGGLRLDRDMFLSPCAPTLHVFATEALGKLSLERHQTANQSENMLQIASHSGGMLQIPLNTWCSEPNYYTIHIGSRQRSFVIRNAHRQVGNAQDKVWLAHQLVRLEQDYTAIEDQAMVTQGMAQEAIIEIAGVLVTGAPNDLPHPLPHLVLLPDGFKSYVVLGQRPGEIWQHVPVLQPGESLLGRRANLLKFSIPFAPQWLVKKGKKNRHYVSAINTTVDPPINVEVGERSDVESWRTNIKRTARHKWDTSNEHLETRWQQYTALASSLR